MHLIYLGTMKNQIAFKVTEIQVIIIILLLL